MGQGGQGGGEEPATAAAGRCVLVTELWESLWMKHLKEQPLAISRRFY